MKLTIGEKWDNDQENYRETVKILGVDGWDNSELSHGDVVVPESDSYLNVKAINDITCEWYETTMTLRDLVNRFERQED